MVLFPQLGFSFHSPEIIFYGLWLPSHRPIFFPSFFFLCQGRRTLIRQRYGKRTEALHSTTKPIVYQHHEDIGRYWRRKTLTLGVTNYEWETDATQGLQHDLDTSRCHPSITARTGRSPIHQRVYATGFRRSLVRYIKCFSPRSVCVDGSSFGVGTQHSPWMVGRPMFSPPYTKKDVVEYQH